MAMQPEEQVLPAFNDQGDLPPGLHRATFKGVMGRFGSGTFQRTAIATRLSRIYTLAMSVGHVRRFIVFGSFITTKPYPNDVDVFLLMEDGFDLTHVVGEARLLFDHAVADDYFGASIFWLRLRSAFDGEDATVSHWQVKRDGRLRGIIEIVREER